MSLPLGRISRPITLVTRSYLRPGPTIRYLSATPRMSAAVEPGTPPTTTPGAGGTKSPARIPGPVETSMQRKVCRRRISSTFDVQTTSIRKLLHPPIYQSVDPSILAGGDVMPLTQPRALHASRFFLHDTRPMYELEAQGRGRTRRRD